MNIYTVQISWWESTTLHFKTNKLENSLKIDFITVQKLTIFKCHNKYLFFWTHNKLLFFPLSILSTRV